MRRDQLLQALARLERGKSTGKSTLAKSSGKVSHSSPRTATKSSAKAGGKGSAAKAAAPRSRARSASASTQPARKSASQRSTQKSATTRRTAKSGSSVAGGNQAASPSKRKNNIALRRIQEDSVRREQLKDLAYASEVRRRLETVQKNNNAAKNKAGNSANALASGKNGHVKDRVVLLVRDPYWLQACWDISRQSVLRAQASMAEHWHAARPVLRLIEVETGGSTSSVERVVRDMEIHGGVNNWYIDVHNPPQSFRVDIGYLAEDGRFHALARSNTVTTPQPGSADAVDRNWTDVAENYEKIYALSGGFASEKGDLQDVFEERLRRPMGSSGARFGAGAERMLQRDRDFHFEVDAEIIVFGSTKPDAHVNISGEPVKLRPDGGFAVRLELPDRRQVLPVTASSRDGVEERTIVLAIERNTKVMEPLVHDPNEQ